MKIDAQVHLKIARALCGLSQIQLSERISKAMKSPVSSNLVSKLESGWKKTVSGKLADVLCKALNITEDELTKGGISVRRK